MADMLHLPHRLSPDAVIGWRAGAPLRHADFLEDVRCWHTLLQDMPGKRFALYFNDTLDFGAALLGAWHAGKIIYLPADTLPATCAALQEAVDGYLGEFPAACNPRMPDRQRCGTAPAFPPMDPDFTGLMVYTSGSTGAPQAIPKKLSQLAAEIATLERVFGAALDTAEIVATVSHQHIYGLLFKLLWPLSNARPIHARSLAFPEELAALTSTRNCVLISSPAHLKRLPDSPAWTAVTHRVRTVFSSGGPLPGDVVQATIETLGLAPIEVYGSSETGGIAWRQRTPGADASWSALPGVTVRIDEEGLLQVRSPHLPDAGWFRGSDRARAMADDRFQLLGRVDRIVKIEEKRISLDRLETALAASPLVAEARVLVLHKKRQGIAAVVVPSAAGRHVLATEGKLRLNGMLRDALAATVERVALPRSWRYADALPVNAQGKTTQAELAALFFAGQLAARPILPQQRLLEKDGQRVLFELTAPASLLYFEGHFPVTPILAGVVQVDWALALGRQHFDLPGEFRGMQVLKFQRVIRPDTPVSLELLLDAQKSCLAFRYFSAAGPYASGRLVFGADDV